ncbi:MAG: hypothetical protein PHE17_14995 [Thiothrix sp.]|nr:hypothetical protein [Thiothrix sp.]MDD5394319.1 hypothetical protein [Thiothrix sp.]
MRQHIPHWADMLARVRGTRTFSHGRPMGLPRYVPTAIATAW